MSGSVRRGIILAGGVGSRLHPITQVACKQLMPVYDKPLIYYPLATLMQIGLTEIAIISTPEDTPRFEALFGSGSHLGLQLSYLVQEEPRGIAEAFLLAEDFVNKEPVALILGDNLFHGLDPYLDAIRNVTSGALVFGYRVQNPSRYGVIKFGRDDHPVAIIEKPKAPPSSHAVTGLYVYDGRVCEFARQLEPSGRGELEISDLNQRYLDLGELSVQKLGRGVAWLDTGTFESLLEAGNFIATIERRQGEKIACLEETAFRAGLISADQLGALIDGMAENEYRDYLAAILREHDRN